MRIRKYFFRIQGSVSWITDPDPDPRVQLITDYTWKILWLLKNTYDIKYVPVVNHKKLKKFNFS